MICSRCNGKGYQIYTYRGYIADIVKCDNCHGTGEIKQNNFQRLTESPEKLAEFITDLANSCGYEMCKKCPIKPYCVSRDMPKDKQLLEWLNKESDTE